jgi:hypothetical protein
MTHYKPQEGHMDFLLAAIVVAVLFVAVGGAARPEPQPKIIVIEIEQPRSRGRGCLAPFIFIILAFVALRLLGG